MNSFDTNITYFVRYSLLAFFILFGLTACNTKKFLKEDEFLLKKNNIEFQSDQKVKKKRSLAYELSTIYKQRPNTKLLRLTRSNLWWYYRTDSLDNPNKFQKWIRRRIAEPPALYDEEIAEATAQSMKYYLQHKGYYDAEVTYEKSLSKSGKTAKITYIVKPKTLYLIDSVNFISEDPNVQRILNDIEESSHLKQGEPVSESLYNKEVDRITKTLKNLGYAYFDRNFVDNLTGDSTGNEVQLDVNILTPKNEDLHKVYQIGKISVVPRFVPSELLLPKKDTIIDGVVFQFDSLGMVVRPGVILREIFLQENDIYKEENFIKTKRQLAKLGIYQFVAIQPTPDPDDPSRINFQIRLTPKKKMTIGGDIELNNSNYTGQGTNNSLIGIGLNLNYQNRNFRKNASLLQLQASGGIELDITKFGTGDNAIFSLDILTQANWYIPKFVEFPKIYSGLNKIRAKFWPLRKGLLNDSFYKDLTEKGETKFSASYNRLLLFDFYNYHSFNMSYGFDVQRSNRKRWLWNQTGVNYLLPRFEEQFIMILDSNLFIRNSFTKQLFTGFLFKDIKFAYSSKPNLFGSSWKFIGDFEQSGFEIWGINKTFNAFSENDQIFMFPDTVEFSQYIRLNLDYRRYINIGRNSTLAYKVSAGIARPFGFSDQVPYVKQFYGGGPLGNRAWRIRELGPGGFPAVDISGNQIFYQAGDFKIDLSLEYRFDVFWGFKGAIFFDAGNIWTIGYDLERPGSQLRWKASSNVANTDNFLKQIGIGGGLGLRYDFSYFILGIDMGIKLKNPYRNENGNYELLPISGNNFKVRDDVNFNLMIGYPF